MVRGSNAVHPTGVATIFSQKEADRARDDILSAMAWASDLAH
jgi:hypothetical protein